MEKTVYHSLEDDHKPFVSEIVIVCLKYINPGFFELELAVYTGEKFLDKRTMIDITFFVHLWAHLP